MDGQSLFEEIQSVKEAIEEFVQKLAEAQDHQKQNNEVLQMSIEDNLSMRIQMELQRQKYEASYVDGDSK